MTTTMRHAGIDEAGYGPTLGPLAIACAVAEAADPEVLAHALATTGVKDSKQIHDPGNLAPLEAIALPAIAWCTGFMPDTAADVFAVLGEQPVIRAELPWMVAANALKLPLAAQELPPWDLPGVRPVGLWGALIQPRAYNASVRTGRNKAELEWQQVAAALARAHQQELPMRTVVDRLGGRKFYREVLQLALPDTLVLIEEETPLVSRYRIPHARHAGHEIGFHVGGESASPLTAIASCVAKYARELHMHLLNRHWCGLLPWLKSTAGYPQDAKRWLHQIGTGNLSAWADDLVRLTTPPDV
jgi:ribonuclease HII